MENPHKFLLTNIINYFVQTQSLNNEDTYRKFATLIRIHDKLFQCGDVSFPGKTEIWFYNKSNFNCQLNEAAFGISNDDDDSKEEKQKFLDAARQWPFPVEKLEVRQQRIQLYLKRNTIVESLVKQVLTNPRYGHLSKDENKLVYLHNLLPEDDGEDNLSLYRSKIIHNVLQNVLTYSRCNQIDNIQENLNNECLIELQVKSIASKCTQNTGCIIKCGFVTDPTTRKPCELTFKDYLSIRSNDMTLVALHKNGVRVEQDAHFCALMQRLGLAASTVDLLEVKHSSPVQVILNNQGSTKGASFILYNSARLETLLRKVEKRINEQIYEPLMPIDSVQWNLLCEEEEWQLVYVYIAGFPNLIDRCLEQIETGICSTHLIVQFLNGLVSTFSVYYRRNKILMERRDHLMPFVYARIYLIKAVREVLNKALALLNIEPVEYM